MANQDEKHYVVMTDKYKCVLGQFSSKVNKLIFICNSLEQAKKVESKAKKREEMKFINVTKTKPKYDLRNYFVQEMTTDCFPDWCK